MQATQETIVPIPPEAIETYLKSFIRSALEQSCSKDCSHQHAMELLDRAWESQKLLWKMRREGSPVSIQLEVTFSIETPPSES
ncbi:hypothetical protein [Leptolyngbya ohadii]|uniref:hypothetical protein n=1 Tax=Leptolyngbya ohadii TaxID=1962290 RepID=UPI00117B7103|nr:hypothetical protein [Leptolyngbya ohadii]